MAGRLDGRTAVVTGGSRGIGEAIGVAMAREGATVVLTSRKQEGLDAAVARHLDLDLRARACHVGKPAQRDAFFAWLDAEVGPADILVNNAGTNLHFGPLLTIQEAAWDKTFDVNLKGPFAMSCAVAQRLFALKRRGSIVNISSVYGRTGAPLQGVYGMTKAALISMTRSMAHEWGPAGIRVNVIAPGLVETRFAAALIESPVARKVVQARTAESRHAQPEEIAGAAVFLASDEASYVTGSVLDVDGGYLSG